MNRFLSTALVCLSLTACYGSAPPRPARVALPELSDEAVMNVYSETRTVIEKRPREERTCPANETNKNSDKCIVTFTEVAEPVTHTETTATYGAERINYAQFRVLTDPQYDAKLERLDDMRQRCKRANVPRWIGTTLVLGGLVAALASGGEGTVGYAGYGALGGGTASYLFGYYGFGGRTCNEAAALYRELDLSEEESWKTVKGPDRAVEMKTLADQFNGFRRIRGDAQAAGDAGSATAPAEASEEPAPGGDDAAPGGAPSEETAPAHAP